MRIKTKHTYLKIIILSLITVSLIYATDILNFNKTPDYTKMDLKELQEEVEKHSIKGDLPFEMGLELIKRWSHNSI